MVGEPTGRRGSWRSLPAPPSLIPSSKLSNSSVSHSGSARGGMSGRVVSDVVLSTAPCTPWKFTRCCATGTAANVSGLT
eukprot:scaffold52742_cov59-Phaeocystis_antarctica.AAC.2